jgi:hypothetical protein
MAYWPGLDPQSQIGAAVPVHGLGVAQQPFQIIAANHGFYGRAGRGVFVHDDKSSFGEILRDGPGWFRSPNNPHAPQVLNGKALGVRQRAHEHHVVGNVQFPGQGVTTGLKAFPGLVLDFQVGCNSRMIPRLR